MLRISKRAHFEKKILYNIFCKWHINTIIVYKFQQYTHLKQCCKTSNSSLLFSFAVLLVRHCPSMASVNPLILYVSFFVFFLPE